MISLLPRVLLCALALVALAPASEAREFSGEVQRTGGPNLVLRIGLTGYKLRGKKLDDLRYLHRQDVRVEGELKGKELEVKRILYPVRFEADVKVLTPATREGSPRRRVALNRKTHEVVNADTGMLVDVYAKPGHSLRVRGYRWDKGVPRVSLLGIKIVMTRLGALRFNQQLNPMPRTDAHKLPKGLVRKGKELWAIGRAEAAAEREHLYVKVRTRFRTGYVNLTKTRSVLAPAPTKSMGGRLEGLLGKKK